MEKNKFTKMDNIKLAEGHEMFVCVSLHCLRSNIALTDIK